MATSARSAARQQHLTRAAQSAGEAFACPMPDEAPGHASPATYRLLWIAAGLIVLAAFLTAL
jgi:hypothetical protein